MNRVVFLYERDMPTVSTMRDMFVDFDAAKAIDASFVRLMDVNKAILQGIDALVCIRPNNTLSAYIAKCLKKQGVKTITFCDDDLVNYRQTSKWRRLALKKVLKYSDCVWSPSKIICDKYKSLTDGKRATLIGTVVSETQIKKRTEYDNDPVRIVYAANPNHIPFFDEIIKPVLPDLIEKYGKGISFHFVGVHPDMTEYSDNIDVEYIDSMGLDEFREFIADAQYDIGLAPLPDTEFTRCKYANKYIEYSMAGISGIYSSIAPYEAAVKPGITGWLAENNKESWLKTMTEAIDNKELREEIACNAQEDLRLNYSEESLLPKVIDDISNANKDKTPPVIDLNNLNLAKAIYKALLIPDRVFLTIFYLREGGPKEVIRRIRQHFS